MKIAKMPKQFVHATLRFFLAWTAGVLVGMTVLAAGAVVRELQTRGGTVATADVTTTVSTEAAPVGGLQRMALFAKPRCTADDAMGWLDRRVVSAPSFARWGKSQDAVFSQTREESRAPTFLSGRGGGCIEFWKQI
jgi:hypothetical protein